MRHSVTDFWIVTSVYVVITIYVIARLFPWREVQALTSGPDANLRDIMTALVPFVISVYSSVRAELELT